jgi:hypothetical protein
MYEKINAGSVILETPAADTDPWISSSREIVYGCNNAKRVTA